MIWATNGTTYGQFLDIPDGFVECAPCPSTDYVLNEDWVTDPLNALVCWRMRDAAELDAIATQQADIEIQFDATLKAFALVVLDEINLLREAASLSPRTINQLKNAVKAKL